MNLDRRDFLVAGAGAGAAVLGLSPTAAARCRSRRARPAQVTDAVFDQGVASGQPTCRGITLWTRLAGLERDARVTLEISPDPDFRRLLVRSAERVRAARNFAVHARVTGCPLRPGERYFYRFSTRDADSPVGRFTTALPPDSRQPVRIGFFSCQDYTSGFYTALAGLAREDDLDLVVCLGDYIYERIFDENPVRPDPTGEVETLAAYRAKYALYHSDEHLREVRRRHPLMTIWDDHEVEDNYASLQGGDATERRDVPFPARRANGYRAFFEHMPRIRARQELDRIYGSLRFGANAEVLLLDQRQYRSDQPCGDQFGVANCPGAFEPSQTMLGARQLRWLERRLERTDATWKVIGNQVMIMALDFPARNPVNPDQWDGYKVERERIARHIAERGIDNVTFVTGDIHTFFAGQVTPSGRQPHAGSLPFSGSVATEFVGGAITSDGIPETFAVDETTRLAVDAFDDTSLRANNPHYEFVDTSFKGYGVLEARRDELLVTYRAARTVLQPRSEVFDLARFRVAAGEPEVQVLSENQAVPT